MKEITLSLTPTLTISVCAFSVELERIISSLENKVDTLEKENRALKQRIKELEDDLREARSKIQALESEIQTLKDTLRERDALIERLTKEIHELTNTNAMLKRRIRYLLLFVRK